MIRIYTFQNVLMSFCLLTLLFCSACGIPTMDNNLNLTERIEEKGYDYQKINNNYKSSIENSGLSTLLLPERLKTDNNQEESTRIIKNSHLILTDYNLKRISVFKEIFELTDSLEVNTSMTEKDIELFKENIQIARSESEKNYLTDSTALSLNSQIIDLFKNGCEYQIESDRILFYEQSCLIQFSLLNGELTILSSNILIDNLAKKYLKR